MCSRMEVEVIVIVDLSAPFYQWLREEERLNSTKRSKRTMEDASISNKIDKTKRETPVLFHSLICVDVAVADIRSY